MMTSIPRRTVLRGLGAAIALPWLECMQPARQALAASPANAAPLRLMFFNVPNGIHMPDWTPSAEGKRFDLPKTLTQLSGLREHLTVMTGLTLDGAHAHGDGGGDHARSGASFLTGSHPRKTNGADIQNSISVDQVAAQAIGQKTRFASLELGIEGSAQSGNCDSGYSCAYSSNLSWRNETSPLAKEIDPAAVFDRLFTSSDAASAAQNKSARIQRRKSVLDFVLEDAKGYRRSSVQPTIANWMNISMRYEMLKIAWWELTNCASAKMAFRTIHVRRCSSTTGRTSATDDGYDRAGHSKRFHASADIYVCQRRQ